MSDVERQLADPNFISDELFRLLASGEEFALSIIEKHSHGESFDIEEDTAKAIIAKVTKIQNNDTKRQLILTALALENLAHAIPLLMAENNRRLLNLISPISQ